MAKKKSSAATRRANPRKPDIANRNATTESAASRPPNRRLWLLRLLLAVGVPLLLLLALEGVLRLTGFGYNPDFFVEVPDSGLRGSNQEFGYRFFPKAVARKPVENAFYPRKPASTYRIFVLGSSAAIGVPNAAFNFGRVLGAMLELQFPGTRFEIITTGVTATNSHVVLPIARECARYDPDLFLLYLGNNEVIGPYGIQTSRHGKAPSLSTIRWGIAMRTSRIGQLLQHIGGRLAGQDKILDRWRGMTMYLDNHVGLGDPDLDRIYDNFEQNLTDIAAAAAASGARLLMCTVPSNLADSPPFGSRHGQELAADALATWEDLYGAGRAALAAGDTLAAVDRFQRALRIDGDYADLHFLLGRCYEHLGDVDNAVRAYDLARQHDTLRFRTDSRLNTIVRRVARAADQQQVGLVDCLRYFEAGLTDVQHIPGNELFFEHVHLTFAGNYLLAAALFPDVVRLLPRKIRQSGPARPRPPALPDCARALAYTDWSEYRMIIQMLNMMEHPPFTEQFEHDATMAFWRARLQTITERASPEVQQATYEAYVEALRRRPDDILMTVNFINLLQESGNHQAAQQQLRRLNRLLPPDSPLATGETTEGNM